MGVIDVCVILQPQKNINNPEIYSQLQHHHFGCYFYLPLCLKLNSPVQSHIYGIRYVSHCDVERIHYGAISLRNLLFPAILTISPLFSPSALRGEGQARITGGLNTAHAENIVSKLVIK